MIINLDNAIYAIVAFLLASDCVFMVYVNNSLYKISLVILNLLALMHICIMRKGKMRVHSYFWYFTFFLMWSLLSNVWADNKFYYDYIFVFIYVDVTILTMTNLFDTENKIVIFLNFILFSSIVLIGYIVSFYGMDALTSSRMTNELLNSNVAGRICSFSFYISFFLFNYLHKKIYLLLLPIYGAFILLSGSKGAILSLFILLSVFMLVKDRGSIKKSTRNIIIIIGVIIAFFYLIINVPAFYNIIGKRLIEFIQILFRREDILQSSGHSNMMRYYFIQTGMKMFSSKPITGYGLDMFRYHNIYHTYAHSNFIEIAADLGIIGLLLFYIPYVRAAIDTIRNKNVMPPYWFAFVVAILVNSIFDSFTSVFFNELFDYSVFIVIFCIIEITKCNNFQEEYSLA